MQQTHCLDLCYGHSVVPSRKEAELELLEEEATRTDGRGMVEAIIGALDVQIDQYVQAPMPVHDNLTSAFQVKAPGAGQTGGVTSGS